MTDDLAALSLTAAAILLIDVIAVRRRFGTVCHGIRHLFRHHPKKAAAVSGLLVAHIGQQLGPFDLLAAGARWIAPKEKP